MTEVSYAKQFLTLLDSRPVKLSSDHVADPRNLPAQSAYILPRMPNPFTKRSEESSTVADTSQTGPQSSTQPSLDIKFKTIRPTSSTPPELTLSSQSLKASIYDIKSQIARQTGYVPDKIKVLYNKKPVSDSKTLSETLGEDAASAAPSNVEMSLMFVGAPTATPLPPEAAAPAVVNADTAALEAAKGKDVGKAGGGEGGQQGDTEMSNSTPAAVGKTGAEVLETKEFWEDLRAFVLQRTRDESMATELVRRFREAWRVDVQGAR